MPFWKSGKKNCVYDGIYLQENLLGYREINTLKYAISICTKQWHKNLGLSSIHALIILLYLGSII